MSEVKTIPLSSAVVYLAYTEAPCAEVSVSYGQNMIPQLNISFPACEELERLGQEDRVPVAVFYMDQWYSDTDAPPVPKMRLLFDGEIAGWGYSRSAYQQYITFSCQAHVSILESASAQFFFADLKNYQPGPVSQSNSQPVFVPKELANGQGFLIKKGIFPGSGEIERPFDFIANVLLAMKIGGKPHPEKCSTLQKASSVSTGQQEQVTGNPQVFTKEFITALTTADNYEDLPVDFFESYLDQHPSTVTAVMAFFVKYVERTKFDKRWIASSLERFLHADTLADDKGQIVDGLYESIKNEATARLVNGAFGSIFGQGDSYLKMISAFYAFVYYEILMIPTAQYVPVGRLWVDSASTHPGVPLANVDPRDKDAYCHLGNYISKPMTQFALPPGCNMIFPSMVTDFRYQENYQSQPTRTIASNQFMDTHVPGVIQEGGEVTLAAKMASTEAYPIPYTQDNQEKSRGEQESDQTVLESAFNKILLFPEEFFRGPLTNYVTIPAWYQLLKNSSVSLAQELSDAASEGFKTRLNKSIDVWKVEDTNILQQESSNFSGTIDTVMAKAKSGEIKSSLTSSGAFDTSDVMRTFVRMLHYEARYAPRAGGFELVFNPYIVPSFPFAYIDDKLYNIHMFGLVNSVTHRISATSGWSTSVSFSHGRTMREVYEEAITEFITQKDPVFYESAPKMPNKVVSMMTQLNEPAPGYSTLTAVEYYKNLFYVTNKSARKQVTFDFRKYFETTTLPGGKEKKNTTVPKVEINMKPIGDKEELAIEDLRVTLKLKNSSYEGVKDYSDAMKTVSRPICTLEEYVKFIGSNLTTNMIPVGKYGVSVPVYLVETQKTFYEAGYQRPFVVADSGKLHEKSKFTFRRDWASLVRAYRLKVHNKTISVD